MVKVQLPHCEIYLDGTLRENLDILKEFVARDWDSIGLLTGEEGDGKSSFAAQICYYLDPSFNIDKIVFNAEQFDKAVESLPPGSAILWDEADDWSRHYADRMLIALKRQFKRIRSKRFHIILSTPTFFDMNKYLAIHRSRYMIEVYSNGLERGFFKFYSRSDKQFLFFKGGKFWDTGAQDPSFRGRFCKIPEGFPVDFSPNGEYQQKKDLATKDLLIGAKKASGQEAVALYKLDCVKRGTDAGISDVTTGLILGVTDRTVRTYRKIMRKQLGLDTLKPDSGDLSEIMEGKAGD